MSTQKSYRLDYQNSMIKKKLCEKTSELENKLFALRKYEKCIPGIK